VAALAAAHGPAETDADVRFEWERALGSGFAEDAA
jgi:hypothetical protein